MKHSLVAREMAVLPQTPLAPPDLTVRDLVEYGRYPHRSWWKRNEDGEGEIIEQAMRQTGVDSMSDRLISTLSGGERQRVWIAMAIAQQPQVGQRVAFCQRNPQAARADLMRICAEIREELEPEEVTETTAAALAAPHDEASPQLARRIRGALYVSCAGRGGSHFGAPNAELQIIRHALGDVPLTGFFAGGAIARHHLYGYTGVLTVFVSANKDC